MNLFSATQICSIFLIRKRFFTTPVCQASIMIFQSKGVWHNLIMPYNYCGNLDTYFATANNNLFLSWLINRKKSVSVFCCQTKPDYLQITSTLIGKHCKNCLNQHCTFPLSIVTPVSENSLLLFQTPCHLQQLTF